MKQLVKWVGRIVIGLLILIAIAALGLYIASNRKIGKTWDIAAQSITVPADSATLARGDHFSQIFGCRDCHGENAGGQNVIDAPPLAVLYAPNLTSGEGGALRRYDDASLARAIREGIGEDGRSLFVMPSAEYHHLSDEDVGAIIAWLRQAPPVDNQVPAPKFGPVGRFLLATDKLPGFIPANDIDHDAPRPPAPVPGPTAEYGDYLARLCTGCHTPTFAGTTTTGPDGSPPAKNITPAGAIGGWSFDEFRTTIRTGITPASYRLSAQYMPWPTIAKATDEELEAVYLYLRSLPPTMPQ